MVKVRANQRYITDLRLILNANRISPNWVSGISTYLRGSNARAMNARYVILMIVKVENTASTYRARIVAN